MFTFAILLTCASVAVADLRCYSCDPTAKGQCLNPETDQVISVPCEEQTYDIELNQEERRGVQKLQPTNVTLKTTGTTEYVYACVALYFKLDKDYTSPPSGVYRDCIRRTKQEENSISSCQAAYKLNTNGTITVCHSCNTENCNTMATGGATTTTISAILIMLIGTFLIV